MIRSTFTACLVLMLAVAWGCNRQPKTSDLVYSNSMSAEDPFTKGVNRPPTPETLFRMAKMLEAQGKDEQAFAVLQNSIERYPNYIPSHCGLAALQVRQRKVAAATQTLENALNIAPNDPVVLNDLGMCWLLRGEHERALEYFTRAAANAPDDARYRANMALATGMMGRYEEALALYKQIMRPARAHYNVAVVAEARHDTQRATEEYARAKALDPMIERQAPSEIIK